MFAGRLFVEQRVKRYDSAHVRRAQIKGALPQIGLLLRISNRRLLSGKGGAPECTLPASLGNARQFGRALRIAPN